MDSAFAPVQTPSCWATAELSYRHKIQNRSIIGIGFLYGRYIARLLCTWLKIVFVSISLSTQRAKVVYRDVYID